MKAGQSVLMTAFMLYMSGNTLHIFSIFAIGMALMQPVNGFMSFGNSFAKFEDQGVNLLFPKLLYLAANCAGVLLVMWKFNALGLLPNSPMDLISTLPPPIVRRVAAGLESVLF
jgi:hypothetical protein